MSVRQTKEHRMVDVVAARFDSDRLAHHSSPVGSMAVSAGVSPGVTAGELEHLAAVAASSADRRRATSAAAGRPIHLDVQKRDPSLTGEELIRLHKELTEAARMTIEATKAAAAGRLLIAADSSSHGPHRTRFITPEQYELENGRWPTLGDMDNAFVLIKDRQGNYLSKATYFQAIAVDPALPKAARLDAKDRKFVQDMDALGLSPILFAASRVAEGAERRYQTPAGERERERVFEYPLQAGEGAPDMMIREKDGTHIGIYPKLDPYARGLTLKRLTKSFGPSNVWLKTPENSYETVDTMNRRKANSAEQAYANFMRDPLPKVLAEKGDGVFVNVEKLENVDKSSSSLDGTRTLVLEERTKFYVSSRMFHNVDGTQDLETALREAGLPENVTEARCRPGPAVLVRSGRNGFVAAERFKHMAKRSPLNALRSTHDIYVQNVDGKGNYTGNYSSLAHVERTGRKLNSEQTRQLGLLAEHAATSKATAAKPGN